MNAGIFTDRQSYFLLYNDAYSANLAKFVGFFITAPQSTILKESFAKLVEHVLLSWIFGKHSKNLNPSLSLNQANI